MHSEIGFSAVLPNPHMGEAVRHAPAPLRVRVQDKVVERVHVMAEVEWQVRAEPHVTLEVTPGNRWQGI